MTQRKDESKLAVVFRFGEDGLDFFFTEGDTGNYFRLPCFDALRGVRREPALRDAVVEEGAEEAEFFLACPLPD